MLVLSALLESRFVIVQITVLVILKNEYYHRFILTTKRSTDFKKSPAACSHSTFSYLTNRQLVLIVTQSILHQQLQNRSCKNPHNRGLLLSPSTSPRKFFSSSRAGMEYKRTKQLRPSPTFPHPHQ